MKVRQREIVELPFYLPQGIQNHPALVLSTDDAIELEEAFVAVLITSQKLDDEFSFQLIDDMLSKPMGKPYRQLRLHLVSLFRISDVISNAQQRTKVKPDDFEIIVRQISATAFGIAL
jgi:hypothetical protein